MPEGRFFRGSLAYVFFEKPLGVNSKFKLSGSYFTGIWADQTNGVDQAFTIELTRYWCDDKTIDFD